MSRRSGCRAGELRWLVAPRAHPRRALFGVRHPRRRRRKVRPAHSHPNGEEVIYIISGSGRVLVDGEVSRDHERARRCCFREAHVHMLHNTGGEEMKVVCFFAPPTSLDNYRMHEAWTSRTEPAARLAAAAIHFGSANTM